MNLNLGEKAVDLLRFAQMPTRGDEKWLVYDALNLKYGEKPVQRKLEELARRGYMEYGVSARTGWLTAKGREYLAALDHPPVEEGGEA